ncbi:MAG: hypothetical protein VB997_08685 [Opitutales bacterium]
MLSAPKITTTSGQQASISIGQESNDGEAFDGIYLSLTPTIHGDKVSLVGVTFVGKQTVGEEGVEGKAKEALALLAERQEAESGKPKSGSSSFVDEIELRGMFRMKGKPPRISLHLKNGGSFWIELGQARSGIKLIHVDSSDDDSHAILEKGGRFARVDLKEHTVSDVDFAVALDGGGHAFRQEMKRGQSFVLALDGDKLDGKDVLVEILVGIIGHEKP